MAERIARKFEHNFDFLTQDKEYSLREVHDRFAKHFPKIMFVTKGYNIDGVSTMVDSISRDDVICFCGVSKHHLVKATIKKDNDDDVACKMQIHSKKEVKLLNKYGQVGDEEPFEQVIQHNVLPLNILVKSDCMNGCHTKEFEMELEITANYDETFLHGYAIIQVGDEEPFEQVIQHNVLPLNILVKSDCMNGCHTKEFEMELEITANYDETFLHGYAIIQGVLQPKVVYLPLGMSKIRLVEVFGIKGKSREYWMHYIVDLRQIIPGNSTLSRSSKTRQQAQDNIYCHIDMYDGTSQKDNVHQYELIHIDKQRQREQEAIQLKQAKPLPAPPTEDRENKIRQFLEKSGPFHCGPPLVPMRTVRYVQRNDCRLKQHKEEQTPFAMNEVLKQKNTAALARPRKLHMETKCIDQISKLTIDEVAECLQMLNLGKFMEDFKGQLIDGVMLKELNRDILTKEFRFKSVEAIRLMKFVEDGYIPK